VTDEIVHYRVERAIATVELDSPDNRNALSSALVGQLTAHLETAAADDAVRAVVLTHTGSTFCAGADLRESAAEGGPEAGTRRMLALLRTVISLPKPVVARITGNVRAGGIGLVGACDIAIAGPQASFAFTEVRLGLAPAIISLTTLGRMTERAASRYYLTGETFSASVAERIGLITSAPADMDGELVAVTDALHACSPQGLAASKPLTTRRALAAFDEQQEEMQRLSATLFGSDEAREGMTAFLQRRPPAWAEQAPAT
jgi:enoyl-CoA hydratase/carnithine racemase